MNVDVNVVDTWVGVCLLQDMYRMEPEDSNNEWNERWILEDVELKVEIWSHLIILNYNDVVQDVVILSSITF